MKRAIVLTALLFSFAAGQGATDTLSKDLVLRLFSNPDYPEGDVTDIFVGELPAELPADIPLPPSVNVVGTLLYGENRAQIALDSQQSPEEVISFFKTQLGDWRNVTFPEEQARGFVDSETKQPTFFCDDEKNVSLSVSASRSNASTDVRLNLARNEPYSLCDEDAQLDGYRDTIPMPTLTTPSDAQYRGGGMSSDDTSAIAETVLRTSRSPQNLISDYAAQLPTQGWQLGVRNRAGTQAWHTFSLANDEGKWQGYLVAIALPEGQVQLFFSVAPAVTEDE